MKTPDVDVLEESSRPSAAVTLWSPPPGGQTLNFTLTSNMRLRHILASVINLSLSLSPPTCDPQPFAALFISILCFSKINIYRIFFFLTLRVDEDANEGGRE